MILFVSFFTAGCTLSSILLILSIPFVTVSLNQKKCQTVTSFPLFCPSCWCLWMSVKIYFIFFMFFLFLFVYRKIKLICHGCRTSHSKEKSRNIDPSANTGLRYNEPAERQAQKKRCYKWQPKLRKHCDIPQDLWPLFQYLSPFSLIFIYYFHCA